MTQEDLRCCHSPETVDHFLPSLFSSISRVAWLVAQQSCSVNVVLLSEREGERERAVLFLNIEEIRARTQLEEGILACNKVSRAAGRVANRKHV